MFARYLFVSTLALALDYALLVMLVSTFRIREALAAACAYLCGAVVHYVASRRWVFAPGWLHRRPMLEFGTFLASGVAGLALTTAIVYFATEVGRLPLPLSKAMAVAASYFAAYALRKAWVFRAHPIPRRDGPGAPEPRRSSP